MNYRQNQRLIVNSAGPVIIFTELMGATCCPSLLKTNHFWLGPTLSSAIHQGLSFKKSK